MIGWNDECAGKTYNFAQPLAFMHIPKTSGTAVMSLLELKFEHTLPVKGFDYSLFGSFRDFASFEDSERRLIYDRPGALPPGATLIAGHFALSTLRAAYPTAQIMTILREPYSRLISHWLYWRQLADEVLNPLGTWGDYVRQSREPLTRFLNNPRIACQTDNVTLRLLLWPHPLVKNDEFILPVNDKRLVALAIRRLRELHFFDIVENGNLANNLTGWLARELPYERSNETVFIPLEFRSTLHRELTEEALASLTLRSRLDLKLWLLAARFRLPDVDSHKLREQKLIENIARYALLMG